MRTFHSAAVVLAAVLLLSCGGDTTQVTPEQARAISEEAYIFAYPMIENYKTMYAQAINRDSGSFKGGFNVLTHERELLGPEFTTVVRPNNDTLYSFAWLDLRAEPVVISVPTMKDQRYYSFQLVDMYTYNIGYIGSRTTGFEAGSYIVAGPGWSGTKPDSVTDVVRSETNFVLSLTRTAVNGPGDLETVHGIQDSYDVTTLSSFLAETPPPALPDLTFPVYSAEEATSPGFVHYLSFLLGQVAVDPSEAELIERFGAIGVSAGLHQGSGGQEPSPGESGGLDPDLRDRVQDGVRAALDAIAGRAGTFGELKNNWSVAAGIFGDREAMQGEYLTRAAAAMFGLYGNDASEALYPATDMDALGEPLDGSKQDYELTFTAATLPPVNAFWSMTMYALPSQLMVENAINRYSIGDRTKGLKFDDDGSLTLYISAKSPGRTKASNWLPAPDGPFSLQLRMYWPEPEALEPLYAPPIVRRNEG